MAKFKGKPPTFFWDFDAAVKNVNVYTNARLKKEPIRSFVVTDERDNEGTCMAIVAANKFIKDLNEGREPLRNWL